MADLRIGAAKLSDLSNVMVDFSVASATTDAADGQKEFFGL